MAFLNKLAGHADVGADLSPLLDYLFDDEVVIQSFQFLRDSIVLTNLGIYISLMYKVLQVRRKKLNSSLKRLLKLFLMNLQVLLI